VKNKVMDTLNGILENVMDFSGYNKPAAAVDESEEELPPPPNPPSAPEYAKE
jgi:hypothetical protein